MSTTKQDTDISHLEFTVEPPVCLCLRDGSPCTDVATHRMVLSCGHGLLTCDYHTERARIIRRTMGRGKCSQCGAVSTLVTLEPIT